jgi:hypothetical protein
MKTLLVFLFGLMLYQSASAQAVSFPATGGDIPDDFPMVCFPDTVSGLPAQIDPNFGLRSLNLDITHTYVGDLQIKLQAPNGNEIMISNGNGGSGDDYDSTLFVMDPLDGYIQNGIPPYIGSYYPQESINLLNNGLDPNGVWHVCVTDMAAIDTGSLNWFVLTFDSFPPIDPPDTTCAYANPAGCDCPDGSSDCDLFPDMTNSELVIQDHLEITGELSISTGTPNIGWGPLEVRGIDSCFCDTSLVPCSTSLCPNGDPPKQWVTQRIYHRDNDSIYYWDRNAGVMQYHDSHGHMHVESWDENTLRIKGPGNDPSTWPIVGTGYKISFCLINLSDCTSYYGACTDSSGNSISQADIPNAPFGLVSGCGTEQGIFVGSMDIYDKSLIGQQISLDSTICNGDYYIVSITDPLNFFQEEIETNNWSHIPITLTLQNAGCCHGNFDCDTTSGMAPFAVNFQDQTMPMGDSWYWDFGDGDTSTAQFPNHTYQNPGLYTVTLVVTTNTGCIDTITYPNYITVNTTAGLPWEDVNVYQARLFPNPASGFTTLSFDLPETLEVEVALRDITGRLLAKPAQGIYKAGKQEIRFSPWSYVSSKGVYFVDFIAGNKSKTMKLVVY